MRAGFIVSAIASLLLAGISASAHAENTPPPPANKRNCKNTVPFDRWLADFKREAIAEGIRPETIEETIGGMTPDQGTIARDRKQGFFSQTFIDFYFKLATKNREQTGKTFLKRYKPIFDRAESEFGVPGPVITGFWALESDFGGGMGNLPVLRSLVTLAWDCRRGDFFRGELKAAMKIVERGDLTPDQMIGSWAGELGQTQFLPQHYLNYGVDYDGDGRVDLIHDNADVIGSTAKFLSSMGWKRGEPWIEQVRLTKSLPWEKADLAIKLPRSQWVAWGVKGVGQDLPSDDLPASLVLPMGRDGPAFLTYPNFDVYTQWNQSLTYALTAAHLAARMGGAPNLSKASGNVPSLSYEQIKELQSLLKRRGYDVGEVDGKLGAGTRKAVKDMQMKFGLPADSYPSAELLTALRERS
ncbi:MAG: lytic murein transglycosylase [Hyphomicrobium sp.]|uniref:lytic murein transglycosylase n=1 Tax=Hyphomicrobium sp. TaxID=82 RepID=UPI0039E46BA0